MHTWRRARWAAMRQLAARQAFAAPDTLRTFMRRQQRRILPRRVARIATLLAPALLLATAVRAQDVVGRVTDQTGGVLPGVTIDLVIGGVEHTAVTDGDGRFRFERVGPGSAELTYRLINFSVLRRTIMVAPAGETAVNAVMALAMSADVVVTAPGTFRNIADVENPAENLVGIAASSSQGAITAAQLVVRPIMRPGEVLETVPGLIISQHSGGGKANQYY